MEESPTTADVKPPKPKPGELMAAQRSHCIETTGIDPLRADNIRKLPLPNPKLTNVLKLTPEIQDEICHRLLSGETMAVIVRLDHMPTYSAIWQYANDHDDFKKRWTDAKRDGAHYIADDCLRIADDPTIDPMHKRIMVDTRLRLIKSWHRKAYGDNVQLSGDENGNPVRFFIDGLSDGAVKQDQLEAKDITPKE